MRGFARSRERVAAAGVALDELVTGDALTGAGLEEAMDGVEVAYYLIHSMEGAAGGAFPEQERRGGRALRAPRRRRPACAASSTSAGSCRARAPPRATSPRGSPSRRRCCGAAPESIALRASIVIGARSRSFRFLVRLIERLPVLALPAWRHNRTRPIDGRDVLAYLRAAADAPAALSGRSWDIAGPDTVTYEQLIDRIADSMLVGRPQARASASRSRRSPRRSPPRSPARTRR